MKRSSGILLPIFSLPSPYGIGTLGRDAYQFADFLKAAGQSYWQLLPLGPTSEGDSPYQSFSTFAGNPYLIDLDLLVEDGLLTKEDLPIGNSDPKPTVPATDTDKILSLRIDYGYLYRTRFAILHKAFERGYEKDKEAVTAFAAENKWLPDYALFMAVKKHFGMQSWLNWPDAEIRLRRPEAVDRYTKLLADDIAFYTYLQYLFFRQWNRLREYIHAKGIRIIGDLPIYVALDSADVWAEPHFFQLGEDNIPVEVSGCPPDSFSADGQLWGNPLYDYDCMEADGFGWWIRRVDGARKLFDVIRIDHFRGLESYWAIPYGDKTAKNGCWRKGPGMKLVGVLTSWFYGTEFIAEDLGYLTPEVHRLLKDSGLPGMKVLEFAFDTREAGNYLPHTYPRNCVCYVGTHDNETVRQWKFSATAESVTYARRYLNLSHEEGFHWGMIRGGMSSVADLFVAQIQDYLGLGPEGRINQPGTLSGNWQWRLLPGQASPELARKIYEYTKMYERLPQQ